MSKEVEGFRRFDSWSELIAWLELEGALYYHAPLDLMPRRVRADLRKECKELPPQVRVQPLTGRDFDPFIADGGHLSRFLAVDQAPSSDAAPTEPDTKKEKEPDTLKQVESNHDFYGIPYSSDP